jgi:phospholipid/cholesterol/gamma-HCH transport system substrate-binding protein
MPHRNQLTWGELRVGIFVMGGLTLLIVAIFYVTGLGSWSPKYRLVTYLPEVSGLTTGAPVRVDGIDVGNVDKLSINNAKDQQPVNLQRNIEMVVRIDSKYRDYIRTDSKVNLETEGLLGNRFVNISRGFQGTPLQDNQEIAGHGENGMNQLLAQGADLAQHLNGLSDQMEGLITDIRAGKGSAGKFITNDDAYNKIVSVGDKLDDVIAHIQAGQGTFGKLYTNDDLYTKASSSVTHIDNILGAVEQQKGTFGKLIYNSELHDQFSQMVGKGNSMFDNIQAGKGTLGKLYTDDSLFASYKQAGTNLSNATARFNDTSSSVGKMFNDPQLYDNLTGATADIRLLLNDFRQNPKKFLRVKFSIF